MRYTLKTAQTIDQILEAAAQGLLLIPYVFQGDSYPTGHLSLQHPVSDRVAVMNPLSMLHLTMRGYTRDTHASLAHQLELDPGAGAKELADALLPRFNERLSQPLSPPHNRYETGPQLIAERQEEFDRVVGAK